MAFGARGNSTQEAGIIRTCHITIHDALDVLLYACGQPLKIIHQSGKSLSAHRAFKADNPNHHVK